MGIQLQPNCCEKWLALGYTGWLYDMDFKSAKLTNSRATDVTAGPSDQEGLWGLMRDKNTKKMYVFQGALTNGTQSFLWEIELDGTMTQIVALRPPYDNTDPDEYETQGIAGGPGCVRLDDGFLFMGSANGVANRDQRLIVVDLSGPTVTIMADNYDDVPQNPLSPPITSNPMAMQFHADGLLWAAMKDGSGPGSYSISTIDPDTGIATTSASLSSGAYLVGMEWSARTSVIGNYRAKFAGSVGTYTCDDISSGSPSLTFLNSWDGLETDDFITGAIRLPG